MIIVVAGPAGSGKTTLGRALATALGYACIDLDTITNPLLEGLFPASDGAHWNDPGRRAIVRPARYAALNAALADQVAVGVSAVAIAPFTAELAGGDEWRALCAAAGGDPVVVWLRASPELLARRRSARAADRDAHIVDSPTAPAVPHLAIDAALATPQQVAAVRRALGAGRELPTHSPVFARDFAAGLFDLDGTLIDSTPSVNRSWLRLAHEYGLEFDLLAAGHGQPARQVVHALFPAHLADEALARVIEIESTDLDDVVALAGAAAVLDAVPRAAIVTSGTRRIATNRMGAAGIRPPEVVVTFDDVDRGKPDPQPFPLAAERLGVDPADCVAFEDAPAGLVAARAAGCTTVGIVGTHAADELGDADLLVDGLFQLTIAAANGRFSVRPAP